MSCHHQNLPFLQVSKFEQGRMRSITAPKCHWWSLLCMVGKRKVFSEMTLDHHTAAICIGEGRIRWTGENLVYNQGSGLCRAQLALYRGRCTYRLQFQVYLGVSTISVYWMCRFVHETVSETFVLQCSEFLHSVTPIAQGFLHILEGSLWKAKDAYM